MNITNKEELIEAVRKELEAFNKKIENSDPKVSGIANWMDRGLILMKAKAMEAELDKMEKEDGNE